MITSSTMAEGTFRLSLCCAAFIVLVPVALCSPSSVTTVTSETVREMFEHAYSSYLQHAFPLDELKPISCSGHDTLGPYALTLFDALDTFLVLGNLSEYRRVSTWICEHSNFDVDRRVSVFETTIRILGSLVSNHLLAAAGYGGHGWYNNCLLSKAQDMGERLLKAYDTPTGIPYGTVNLRSGVADDETTISATATGGTVLLEFGLLSRASGDARYAAAADRAAKALWKRRSQLGLLGSHIDVKTGEWVYFDSGVSGGMDSFFEYLLKAGIALGKPEYVKMFSTGYAAIVKHVKKDVWYPDVDMRSGQIMFPFYRSLQSFWPGLQALYGDVEPAAATLDAMLAIMHRYKFVPEAYNLNTKKVEKGLGQYPLRPEVAESLFYLYQATGKEQYRDAGRMMVSNLNTHARTPCGFAAVENVAPSKKPLRDHMDSYFLAETLKYLFLLLDEGEVSAPFRNLSNFVFNTEAHLLPLASPPPAKFIPLLSRSAQHSAADAALPANFGDHDDESSAAAVIAGTVAALLVGFYLCFRWRSGRCYKKEERRLKLRKD